MKALVNRPGLDKWIIFATFLIPAFVIAIDSLALHWKVFKESGTPSGTFLLLNFGAAVLVLSLVLIIVETRKTRYWLAIEGQGRDLEDYISIKVGFGLIVFAILAFWYGLSHASNHNMIFRAGSIILGLFFLAKSVFLSRLFPWAIPTVIINKRGIAMLMLTYGNSGGMKRLGWICLVPWGHVRSVSWRSENVSKVGSFLYVESEKMIWFRHWSDYRSGNSAYEDKGDCFLHVAISTLMIPGDALIQASQRYMEQVKSHKFEHASEIQV